MAMIARSSQVFVFSVVVSPLSDNWVYRLGLKFTLVDGVGENAICFRKCYISTISTVL
ncbi:unnamed protein product [Strongylus vulgaris]|uniref:Uncharacterized protein n=1 Tax=Strongylus vulgaris TaxID=40348 RepID=A0A3P7JTY4_STRVU|nr:unnamed protein product [Strongylus vulgaris]